MNRFQLSQSLKDLLPTYSGEFPGQLVAYTDSLYQLSLQKIPSLPHKADVARHHLCAYLAIEKYRDRFSLPALLLHKIPLQPRFLEKVLNDLEQKVAVDFLSPLSSHKRPDILTPKRLYAPGTGSPLKKLQKLASDDSAATTNKTQESTDIESPIALKTGLLRDENSPFNVKKGLNTLTKKNTSDSPLRTTPGSSPRKVAGRSPLKKNSKSPQKLAGFSSATTSSFRYVRHVSIPDFISFANNFYIPASVTPQLLETFFHEQHKFLKRNDWILACGLIHAAYIRINHRLLQNTLGRKTEFQDQLFQYQKGGLMKTSLINWINIIEESVKSEPWAVDLELKYVHNDWSTEDTTQDREIKAKLGKGWEIFLALGSMINPSVMFEKASQVEYYNVWTERVFEKLNSVEEY